MLDPATTVRLLAHLGLAERPAADAAGLRTVHRAFLSHIAYAGLTPQLGEHVPLAVEPLVGRLLSGGRGGYCFEMNTVLMALLEALGFVVERREAVVAARGARGEGAAINHMALVVTLEGGATLLADAGWGEGPLDPIPLRPGSFSAGPLRWTVEREAGGGWWIGQHEWGSTPGFWFADEPASLVAFAPHHLRLATAPDSSFVTTLVVQQPFDDRVVTLRARTLSTVGPGRDERTVLPDAAAFATVLCETFAIDPDALGAERLERLWTQACAQHAAYVRATSG